MAGKPSRTTAYNEKSGTYCVGGGNSTFYEKANPDGSLMIELDAAGGAPNHGVFSIYGQAAKISEHHWRYIDGMQSSNPDDKCQVDIRVDDKGWHLLTSKVAQCLSNKGAGAPGDAPLFPLGSYVAPVTTQLDADGGNVTGDDCKPLFPHTPAPKP